MTNAEKIEFLSKEIDKLLSVRKQSRIILKKNDYEFLEKRALIWLNKNTHGQVPCMSGFDFSIDEKRRPTAIWFRGIEVEVMDIEGVKKAAA